ncbi:MAG: hypothetical protein HND58_06945 [Planctomycetota bacterium]|nr:MAG: hypothetical protein HND58_06945 [Planctomycetota bacterium]
MTDPDRLPAPRGPLTRTIADLRGGDGPTLICTGGVHGNEPAGIYAAREVARKLQTLSPSGSDPAWRGRFVAMVGNVAACNAADPTLRYIEHDLNRLATPEEIDRARALPPAKRHAEQQELLELIDALRAIAGEAPHASTLLDLHTVSSPSPAFAYGEDSLPARRLGRALGLPLVLGFEEELSGLLADYATSELGVLSLVVEAGTHSDPESVSVHEAAIWTVLEAQGMVKSASDAARFDVAQRLRAAAGRKTGRVFDIRQRVPVGSPPLEMLETAQAFTRVWKGLTRVATRHRPDRTEVLRAPADGLLFMPNRQPRKRPEDDAFFVLRPVWRRFMWVSARLRAMPAAHRLLEALPGVRRADRHTLHIDPSIAAVMARDVLHLFGYRVLRGTPAPFHRPWTRAAMACIAIPRALGRSLLGRRADPGEVWIVRRHRLDL